MASFDYHILVEGIMVEHELSLIEMETIMNKTIKRKVDTVNDNQLCMWLSLLHTYMYTACIYIYRGY